MIKLYKIMLALTVLIVVVSNILVEAQVFPTTTTSTTPKEPPKTPPKTPPPPPPTPPPPPPKTTDPPPPPPPPPPPKTTDPALPPPPPITTNPLPSPLPPPPPKLPPPPQTTPETPVSTQPLSPLPTPQLCTTTDDCDNTKFCNQGKCQPRGSLGDKCVNRDACLSQLICNKGVCQYRDNGPKNSHNYDVKKAAITGGIIVGVFVVSGFIFFVYRGFKNREGRKGRGELTSSLYSTDGTGEFDPIYPFSERTNSFSNNKPTSPSHVPTTNHYDPLPSNGSGGFVGGPGPRQGYYNYYNNDYNGGGYVMQNENEATKRTMKLLQQTRGNVMIAPHAPPHAPHAPSHIPHAPHPPHLQQNYNWNYGVPGAPPAQQQLMMNQGVLFPVPSVKRNYGGHIPNNDIKNNVNNKNNNSSNSYEDKSKRTLSPNVNTGDKQKKTQNLRDLLESNSNSVDSLPSNNSENGNVESIYDTYARESVIKPKTLEVKLSQATNNNDNKDDLSRNTPGKRYDPTIDQSTSKDSKSITGRSRSRTFGHADSSKPLQSKSSTVGQQNESKGLNGINENDEF